MLQDAELNYTTLSPIRQRLLLVWKVNIIRESDIEKPKYQFNF